MESCHLHRFFLEYADDNVIVRALMPLALGSIIPLFAASRGVYRRIAGPSDVFSESVSIARRLVAHTLADDKEQLMTVVVDAIGEAVNCQMSGLGSCLNIFRAMVWLSSGRSAAAKLGNLAMQLAEQNIMTYTEAAETSQARRFAEAVFNWDAADTATVDSSSLGAAPQVALEAAFNAIWRTGYGATGILISMAGAVRAAEQDLDEMVESNPQVLPKRGGFEVCGRVRSAAEYMRSRIGTLECGSKNIIRGFLDVAAAQAAFELAVKALDETIHSYAEEGYDLSCPHFVRRRVPYSHWWMFLGGQSSYGMCA